MDRAFPYWILAALGLLLATVNAFAVYYHLFFYVWWLDIPLHLLCGLWIGLLVLSYYYSPRFPEPKFRSDPAVLRTAVVAALIVGLCWELFEFSTDKFIVIGAHDMQDTMNDLLNDIIGGVFAAEIFVTEGFNKLKQINNP